MKRYILPLSLTFFALISYSQSNRSEVIEKVSTVYDITENTSLVIKTANYNNDKLLIENGIFPLIIGTYTFKEVGLNALLSTATEVFYSKDRSLVSKYSNEQNPKRLEYVTFWLSQVATHTYGDVLKNKDGFYYTKQVWFNLE
ncbi:hypothetical protein N9R11_03870 [Polaribacter sp.]|nr:hypothetical protein [Polaribacter sp.]